MKSPKELISLLRYPQADSDVEDFSPIGIDPTLVTSFILQFSRYLHGIGHPHHPRVRAVVPGEQMVAEKENPTLRCELFLQQVSGSTYLPADEFQDIHVRPTINELLRGS